MSKGVPGERVTYGVGRPARVLGLRPLPYFFSNFSIRPAVSISFCFPVKNGWQLAQMATLISSVTDFVSKVFPQAHFTVAVTYSDECFPHRSVSFPPIRRSSIR